MADWTDIPNASIEPDAPVRSIDGLAFRDNPIAIAEGAPGAPRVQAAGLGTGNNERDWVLARTAGGAAGAVGTYAFAWRDSTATPPAFGGTLAGSGLRPAGLSGEISVFQNRTVVGSTNTLYLSAGRGRNSLPGTWRCMGEAMQTSDATGSYPHTLWLRIS